jgi:hypothetical protein
MTAYFDRFETDVANAGRAPALSRWQQARMTIARWLAPALAPRPVATWDALYALDERIVRDVSIAVMMPTVPTRGGVEERPACPAAVAAHVHRLIARYSVSAQGGGRHTGSADYETDEEYRAGLLDLSAGLHAVFHELAHIEGWRYGDELERVTGWLVADAEQAREDVVMLDAANRVA